VRVEAICWAMSPKQGHAGVRGAGLGVIAQVSNVRSALATAPKRVWRELAAPLLLPNRTPSRPRGSVSHSATGGARIGQALGARLRAG
jgi:hypothetical protein